MKIQIRYEEMCQCKAHIAVTIDASGLSGHQTRGIPTGRYYFGREACGACGGFIATRSQRSALNAQHVLDIRATWEADRRERKRAWGDPVKETEPITVDDVKKQETIRISFPRWPRMPDQDGHAEVS